MIWFLLILVDLDRCRHLVYLEIHGQLWPVEGWFADDGATTRGVPFRKDEAQGVSDMCRE